MAVLSILDPSPVFAHRTAADALAATRALAEAADNLGYRSFWVQEHHNLASFAGTAPEVQIADLAARTDRLILGSGGVMLANYSPLKVAETFSMLSALYPGRIELGLGRASGADPRTTAALLGPGADAFPQMLRLLMDWLLDSAGTRPLPADHRARGIHANPPAPCPDLWLLTSSSQSAAFAGAMGLKLAFADFLSPGGAGPAIDAYHAAFEASDFAHRPHAAIGLSALCAETEAEARRLASPAAAWSLNLGQGRGAPFAAPEVAVELLAGQPQTTPAQAQSRALAGAAADVAEQLAETAEKTRADEFFLIGLTDPVTARVESYGLLMEAWQGLSDR